MKNTGDELEKDFPLLADLRKKEPGLKTPEAYFDNFETRLMERIQREEISRQAPSTAPGMRAGRLRLPVKWLSAAAAISMALGAVWVFRTDKISVNEQQQPLAAYEKVELSAEEAEAWLWENAHEFDVRDLAALPEVPAETTPQSNQKKTPKHDINPEDLESLLDQMSEEELEDLL